MEEYKTDIVKKDDNFHLVRKIELRKEHNVSIFFGEWKEWWGVGATDSFFFSGESEVSPSSAAMRFKLLDDAAAQVLP